MMVFPFARAAGGHSTTPCKYMQLIAQFYKTNPMWLTAVTSPVMPAHAEAASYAHGVSARVKIYWLAGLSSSERISLAAANPMAIEGKAPITPGAAGGTVEGGGVTPCGVSI